MSKLFIFIMFVCTLASPAYSQNWCRLIKGHTTIDEAEAFLAWINQKDLDLLDQTVKPAQPIRDTFLVLDTCSAGNIMLIEIRRANDSIGYYEITLFEDFPIKIPTSFTIITLCEDIDSGEVLTIGQVYPMLIKPYFYMDRLFGDFYYPIIVGTREKVAVEAQMPANGNFYTSPNIVGKIYLREGLDAFDGAERGTYSPQREDN